MREATRRTVLTPGRPNWKNQRSVKGLDRDRGWETEPDRSGPDRAVSADHDHQIVPGGAASTAPQVRRAYRPWMAMPTQETTATGLCGRSIVGAPDALEDAPTAVDGW